MSVFRFPLQSLLDLRGQMEKEGRETYAREFRRLQDFEELSRQIEQEQARWSKQFLARAGAGFSPAAAEQIGAYLIGLGDLKRRSDLRVQSQRAVVEKTREELVSRMKDRKLMEALHGRRLEAWRLAEQQQSQREVDDLLSERHAREQNAS